jgi:chromosome segregation ATPase
LITLFLDLLSSLSVLIRLSSLLDDKTSSLEAELKQAQMRLEAMKEQFLILKEKDRLSGDRNETLQGERDRFKSQMEKLERMYSDVFVQAQALKRRYSVLERYRASLKKVLPEVHRKSKLYNPDEYARKIEQIVKSYEAKLYEIKNELEKVKSETHDSEQLFQEKLKLENSLVFERRQHELTRTEAKSRLETLESDTLALRHQVKELLIAREVDRQELETLRADLPSLQEDRKALHDQVDTLQLLWEQKQNDLEKLEQKVQGLQKLNQAISGNLNEKSKEISRLEAKLEQERLQAKEREQTLKAEIKLLRC